MERKISKQVIESLGSTDNMSSVEEKTPTVSLDQDATGETATSVWLAEVDETPRNSKITSRDFKNIMEGVYSKGRWKRALFPNSTK